MRPRRRSSMKSPESLEGVLGRAGEHRFAIHRPPIATRIWTLAMGVRVAERAKPISLENGVLTVRVATSVWANELSFLQASLLERLRDQGVAVNELRFRVGPIDAPARPPERRLTRAVPAPATLPRELAAHIATIEDRELQEAITLAARANLAWQENVDPPQGPTAAPRGIDQDEPPQRVAASRSSPSKR
jgi:predicted nucleic acid-binding Zn ribbon protein